MPPSTTIARMMADSMKVKLSGLMKPWRVAKNDPAKPPNMALIVKAASLMLRRLMPSELAGDVVLAQRLPRSAERQPSDPERRVNAFTISARTRIR